MLTVNSKDKASPPLPIEFRPARLADAPTLAKLMVEGLSSRLNDLGPWFVTLLHRHMITSPYNLCIVAEQQGMLVGYGAVLTPTRKFYLDFLLRKGLLCVLITLPWLFRPKNLHVALRGFTYFPRSSHDDPEAELVSLVISPNVCRAGIGTALFLRLVEELRSRGIDTLKICTSAENDRANAFYRRQGCQYIRTDPFYQNNHINVYVHKCV